MKQPDASGLVFVFTQSLFNLYPKKGLRHHRRELSEPLARCPAPGNRTVRLAVHRTLILIPAIYALVKEFGLRHGTTRSSQP